MYYWDRSKRFLEAKKGNPSVNDAESLILSPDYDIDPELIHHVKSRTKQKLLSEQEMMMFLMKLRLGLMVDDLAFRFQVSPGKVSQIFITWNKLMSKELGVLVILPSQQVKSTLPACFRKLFPNTRVIINRKEVFIETPNSLEVQACLYTDYKHPHTVKFLVCITPNGAVSWVSPVYRGCKSDVFIIQNSSFLDLLEIKDQVMADRGFKTKTDLAMKQCFLCIPPSASKGNQMTIGDVKKTSNMANVGISFKRMK